MSGIFEAEAFQREVDRVSPELYLEYGACVAAQRGGQIEKFEREYPVLAHYAASARRIAAALRNPADGRVWLWLLYNMGYVVRTPKCCFGIDLHHFHALQLAGFLDFLLITHEHDDHWTPELADELTRRGKPVFSRFLRTPGLLNRPECEIQLNGVRLYAGRSDHNAMLRDFVTPFECVCESGSGERTIYTSGDSCRAEQLRIHAEKLHCHIVHPYVGMDPVEAAQRLRPELTLVSHLWEFHHRADHWRWSFQDGCDAVNRLRENGFAARAPLWGEEITL